MGNLAPFSFFNGVSSNPPAVMISAARNSNGTKKDTLINIESTQEFVVNSVGDWMIEAVNQCSAQYPYGVNEMSQVGLTAVPSARVKPPRVAESLVHFECRVLHTYEIGDGSEGSSTVILGEVLLFHVDSTVYQEGKILLEPLHAVSRLAGKSYGKISEVFDLPRPQLVPAIKPSRE
jgi:flavin reductase (DIM6/NTAB) family NADH-FMN oxidoreductase RutF